MCFTAKSLMLALVSAGIVNAGEDANHRERDFREQDRQFRENQERTGAREYEREMNKDINKPDNDRDNYRGDYEAYSDYNRYIPDRDK